MGQQLPRLVRPMLATLGPLPTGPGWAFEAKYDGIRAILYVADKVRILSRNDRDVTGSFPEIAVYAAALGIGPVILDGEIVALDQNGAPSFSILSNRMHVRSPTPSLLRAVPVHLFAFDLLHLGAESTLSLPYTRRREQLETLGLEQGVITAPPAFAGDGLSVQAAAEDLGLEGV